MVDANERPDQMLKLMSGLAKFLPDMNITVTGHDVPWIVLSGEHRANLLAKSKAGMYLSAKEAEDVQDNWDYDGWAVACPPNSALRSVPKFDDRIVKQSEWVPPPPSFIQDHVPTMDMCEHPERSTIHGFTSWCVTRLGPSVGAAVADPRSRVPPRAGQDLAPDSFTPSSPSPRRDYIPTSFCRLSTNTTDPSGAIPHGRRRRVSGSSGGELRRGHCWTSRICGSGVSARGCVGVSPCLARL